MSNKAADNMFSGVQQPKSDLLPDMPNDAVVETSSKAVLYFDQDENGGLNLALQVKFGVKSLKFLLQEMVFNSVKLFALSFQL
ncbi:hypothetical protein Tco_0247993 [Tanacetum coccineum]